MKPEILLMRAIYAPTMAELERDFTVHRLWSAPEPEAFIRQVCANVRAAITTTFDDLESMAREADVMVVTCPLTPATRNLVDARVLAALGADGFLVNVARGAIVDEAALIAALIRGQIAGAALDVFRDEPHVPAELMRMDNVVLAPHIGTSTREIREGRSKKLLADMRAFFSGRPLLHKVTA